MGGIKIGVIGGSGVYKIEGIEVVKEHKVSTPFGAPSSEIIEANLSRYYRVEGFDETGFRRNVKEAIQNGYGTFDNIVLDRTTSGIGIAILDPFGQPVAAIGTTFLTGWLTEDQRQSCIIEVGNSARKIEELLFKV